MLYCVCVVNAHKTATDDGSLVTRRRKGDNSSFDSTINRMFSNVEDEGILCYGIMIFLDRIIRKRKKRLPMPKLSQDENEVEERSVISKLLLISLS